MSVLDNEGTEALRSTLSRARSTLSRQQSLVKSSIALIKLLEAEIADREKRVK